MMKRVAQVARKEFIQIRRDRGLLRMVVLAPLLQLLIYGYVVATEIRALPMAVLDQLALTESRRLVDRLVASGYLTLKQYVDSAAGAERQLNSRDSHVVLVIPEDYAHNI